MKRIALKGLLVLGGIVLLCVFFSGTLHTLSTAKVRTVSARTGRLETRVRLTGALHWPETEAVIPENMTGDDTLIVRRVNVSAGAWVLAGDCLAECEVADYDSRMAALKESFAGKEKEALELQWKNSGVRLTPQQEEWYAGYSRLRDAALAEQEALQTLRLRAWQAGVALEEDDSVPETLPDTEAAGLLVEARDVLEAARRETAEASRAFDSLSRYPIPEDVVNYLSKKSELEKELASLSARMADLQLLKERAAAVTAPHDGYVTAAETKAGDTVSRGGAVVWMTAEGAEPAVRLDASGARRTIPAGTAVTLSVGGKTADAAITGQGIAADGSLYADVRLRRGDIGLLGGAAAMTESGSVTAEIVLTAENATTLIPVSALRGAEGDYFIYVTRRENDSFRNEKITVVRKSVTVLGQSASAASLEESLRNEEIVYMEDRPLSEGCEVMPYSSGS